MDALSLVDMLPFFEAPKQDTSPIKTHLRHHTIFTVDTALNRKDRIRKPSVRAKEHRCGGGKRDANERSQAVCQAIDTSHFLWCSEDASFLFRPLDPDAADRCAKGVLPHDPDQLDAEEYDELQLIYESLDMGSC